MDRTVGRATLKGAALAVVVLAALLVSACGGSGDSAGSTAQSGGTQEAVANNFSITTLDGEQFELADRRGDVVALFFMAGWCATCIPEAQAWAELYPEYRGEGLDLLMVSSDPSDTPESIAEFRSRAGIDPLPWAIDKDGTVTRSLDVNALDSTVIIDRNGSVAFRDAAPTNTETLRGELEKLL
jgi:peroxiredoxin